VLTDLPADHVSGPNTRGPHADEYGDLLDHTGFAGLVVPTGSAWRAKDILLQEIVKGAQEKVKRHGQDSPPDPAILFSLPNELHTGANFFAFERTYEGPFSLDVFYDTSSAPVGGTLDSMRTNIELG
jgi:mannosyl-oligosaccharide glucosidase